MPPKIAITMGDPAGIGPEVAVYHRAAPGEELLPRVGEDGDLRADPRGVPHRDGDLRRHDVSRCGTGQRRTSIEADRLSSERMSEYAFSLRRSVSSSVNASF